MGVTDFIEEGSGRGGSRNERDRRERCLGKLVEAECLHPFTVAYAAGFEGDDRLHTTMMVLLRGTSQIECYRFGVGRLYGKRGDGRGLRVSSAPRSTKDMGLFFLRCGQPVR